MNTGQIAALVLAAGLSRRMPTNKLLACLPNGRNVIRQSVENILASTARPVLVVTGHQPSEIMAALTGVEVEFVAAPDYAAGLSASLRAGIQALPAGLAAVLICLGDMPLLKPATLNSIISAYNPQAGHEIVRPYTQGQPGNPVLFGARFFPALAKLKGDTGAQQILPQYRAYLTALDVDDSGILQDFDTAEDFTNIEFKP